MSLFGRNDEKNVGDWGLRNGSLIDPILCIEVNTNSRSKTLTCLLFDLKSRKIETIYSLSHEKLWINPPNTPVDSPKNVVIEDAKKLYREVYSVDFTVDPQPSTLIVAAKVAAKSKVVKSTNVPLIRQKQQTVPKIKSSKAKVPNKEVEMGQTSSSNKNQDQEQVENPQEGQDFSTQSAYDQIQAGRAAASIVLNQSRSIEIGNGTNTITSSSTTSSTMGGVKTKTKVRQATAKATVSIGNTLQDALNQTELEEQAKERRKREQQILLQDMHKTMQERALRMNGGSSSSGIGSIGIGSSGISGSGSGGSGATNSFYNTNGSSSSSSSNNPFHTTEKEDDESLEQMGNMDSKTQFSGNSTLTESNSMLQSSNYPARILNQNGKESKSHCFLSSDLLIDQGLKNQINNDSPRFAGHGTRKPHGVGLCYVNVWNGVEVVLVCIEEHLDLLTKIVYSVASQDGIMRFNHKDESTWSKVKGYMLDKNAVWMYKDMISVSLATAILNSPYMKEYHGKWSNQVSSILLTMKTNFTPDENGK